MSKARKLADLIEADGDIKAEHLEYAALKDLSNVDTLPTDVIDQLKGANGSNGSNGTNGTNGSNGAVGATFSLVGDVLTITT